MAKIKPEPKPLPKCSHCGGDDVAYYLILKWVCRSCHREFAGRLWQEGDPYVGPEEKRSILSGGDDAPK